MKITFIQTSDPVKYVKMLGITSQTVKRYAGIHGHDYYSYIGIKRGAFSHYAKYNRVYLLNDILECNAADWVCYLDADAYIVDFKFNLREYLEDKKNTLFIAAPAGTETALEWCDINNGVFLINMKHHLARPLLNKWKCLTDDIPLDVAYANYFESTASDQVLLKEAMIAIDGVKDSIYVEDTYPFLLNYDTGRFIRQILRTDGALDKRIYAIKNDVENILSGFIAEPEFELDNTKFRRFVDELVWAFYSLFLMREPEPSGHDQCAKSIISGDVPVEVIMQSMLGSEEFSCKSLDFLYKYAPNSVATEMLKRVKK